jgi:sugar phosphate isomerase/epimerase
MRLSIVNDQLSLDLHTALEIIAEFQCKELELRQVGFDAVPNIDERWIAIAEKAVNARKLRVTSLHSDLFRASPPSDADAEKVLSLAARLKAQLVIVGGCATSGLSTSADTHVPNDTLSQRDSNIAHDSEEDEEDEEFSEDDVILPPEKDLEAYRKFATEAERRGIQVALTPDPESYAGTAEEAVALVTAVGVKNFGLDWDVAGCFGAGDGSGLDALEDVLPVMKSLRVRDAVRRGMGADWVSLGKGVIPWEDIFEQLYEGGFRGPVILEPRFAPKIREARAALPMVARWIDVCRLKKSAPSRGGRRDRDEDE